MLVFIASFPFSTKHRLIGVQLLPTLSLLSGRLCFSFCFFLLFLIVPLQLRLGPDTLVYGSEDAGVTVHNDHPELDHLMHVLAARLNLKEHPVKV